MTDPTGDNNKLNKEDTFNILLNNNIMIMNQEGAFITTTPTLAVSWRRQEQNIISVRNCIFLILLMTLKLMPLMSDLALQLAAAAAHGEENKTIS